MTPERVGSTCSPSCSAPPRPRLRSLRPGRGWSSLGSPRAWHSSRSIGHRAPWSPAVAAQRRTSWSFALGDLALLVAVIVAIATVGDIDLRSVGGSAVDLDRETVAGVSTLTVVAVLLVVAGVARSALIPIHRWLPSTLAAPTPVSALLHAGVVNGAGVLLIRFAPIYGCLHGRDDARLRARDAHCVGRHRRDAGAHRREGWPRLVDLGPDGLHGPATRRGRLRRCALPHRRSRPLQGDDVPRCRRSDQCPSASGFPPAPRQRRCVRRCDRHRYVLLVGLVAPLAAFALAMVVIDPHLTASATILIVVFGTLSIGRAANGWMTSTPFATAPSIGAAVGGVVVGSFAYVGGITLFEHFVVDVVPYDVPGAVGPVWVGASLAADRTRGRDHLVQPRTGRRRPASKGLRVAALDGNPRTDRPGTAHRCTVDHPSSSCRTDVHNPDHRGRTRMTVSSRPIDRSVLVADVARAGAFVSPYWPLTSFVAVNPLGGLQDHSFAEATTLAARWFRRPNASLTRRLSPGVRPRHDRSSRPRPLDPAPPPLGGRCSCDRSRQPARRRDRRDPLGPARRTRPRFEAHCKLVARRRARRGARQLVCHLRRRCARAVGDAGPLARLLPIVAGPRRR